MKKFKISTVAAIALYAMLCVVFSGCDSTPIINGQKPFIVNQIDEISSGMCEYYGGNDAKWDGNGFSGRPSIVLPKGMYNIGDTVRWQK
jgi:hypothetical protein